MFLRGRHRRPGVHQQVSPRINSQQLQSRNRYTNRRFARFGIFVLLAFVPVFLLNPFRNNAVVTSDPSNAVQPLLNTDTDYDQQSKIVEQPSASLTLAGQMEWIQNEFRAADPNEQEWCKQALTEGTYWRSKALKGGAQFSQDIFLARNLFFERYVRLNKKGYYVEAGGNHFKQLSSTYFYDKCLGWEGLCVEPQRQYQTELKNNRTCSLVPMCLTKERTDKMMIGGRPAHRGAGMFIRPLPEDGKLPVGEVVWEQISCAPLAEVLNKYARNDTDHHHIDLFVLDVEGAELPVLDTIDWERITFTLLQIEVEHMNGQVQEKLKFDMSHRGYELAYELQTDSIFVPKRDIDTNILPARNTLWEPPSGILGLKE